MIFGVDGFRLHVKCGVVKPSTKKMFFVFFQIYVFQLCFFVIFQIKQSVLAILAQKIEGKTLYKKC